MERRLAAILSYDVVGYSRAIGQDEASTLEGLKIHRREVIEPGVSQFGGRIVKFTGDGALVEFASVVDAVSFALHMQNGVTASNDDLPEAQRLAYRVGINVGDVVVDDDDVYGDGVNVAVRIEALAEPGEICIDRSVRDQLSGRLDLTFEDLGAVEVKNIERPVNAFRVIRDEKAGAALAASPAPRLAEQPAQRSRLPWFAAVALALVVVGAAIWWQTSRPEFDPVDPAEMAEALPDKPSMAVLALDDLSTGDDKGYLSDAIAEGIITELSRFSEFLVIARNSSFKYRDTATDVRTIATELGVHYIVEGSQQKSGDKVRVTVQLIDALAGNHIWAETYDRDLADLFAVQDEIVREVASAIGAKVAFRPPPSGGLAAVSALHLNLQGRPHLRAWTKEGTQKGLELNLAAVEADPTSPFGYIGLSFVYPRAEYGWLDMDGAEGFARAEQAADKALELDPDNYDAHYARGFVHKQRGEHRQAFERYRRALELNPNAANVMADMAETHMYGGRIDEALDLMTRAMRLDPHHPDWFKWNFAWAQWANGDCDSALSAMHSMTKIPNSARRMLAIIQVCLGLQDEAEATIKAFLEKAPDMTISKLRERNEKRYSDTSILERSLDALRQAGMPE